MSQIDLDRLRLDPRQRQLARGSSRWLIVAALFLLAGGAFLHWLRVWGAVESDASPESAMLASRQGTTPPEPRKAADTVVAGGFLEARRGAVIYPGRDGVVAAVHVEPGQHVSKDELLLELVAETAIADLAAANAEARNAEARRALVVAGSREEEVQRARAQSNAAEAEWQEQQAELSRVRKLAELQIESAAVLERAERREQAARARLDEALAYEQIVRSGSRDEELLLAAAEVEQAKAAVQRAEALLDLSQLRAPFDATVVRIDLEPGEVVSMISSPYGQPGIEIADVSELWARLDVPETRIASVSIGASATVVVEAIGPAQLEAEVVEIAPVADRQSNTVSVAVRILEPPDLIRPNMSARVTIHCKKERS